MNLISGNSTLVYARARTVVAYKHALPMYSTTQISILNNKTVIYKHVAIFTDNNSIEYI